MIDVSTIPSETQAMIPLWNSRNHVFPRMMDLIPSADQQEDLDRLRPFSKYVPFSQARRLGRQTSWQLLHLLGKPFKHV